MSGIVHPAAEETFLSVHRQLLGSLEEFLVSTA